MASSKYEVIWQLLSINDFKEEIAEKYHCTICKNVSIEPFIALCKCRFCSNCIKAYLKDGRKHCPGIKNDCKEEYLEIDVNVTRDLIAIRSMGRIRVNCPNETCEERCDLENMSDHLRVCGMSKTKCPYENIGCQLRQISKDNIKIHYDDEWFTHSQLLVEAIDNLRNDGAQLRKVVERRDEEINKLNEDSRIREMELQRQIDDQRNDIDNIKHFIVKKDEEMVAMQEEFRMMIETQKKTMMDEFENIKQDKEKVDIIKNTQKKTMMEELKIKDERRDREMEVMKETQKKTMMEELKIKDEKRDREMEEFRNIKEDIVNMDVREDLNDQNKTLNDLKENQENIKREISSVIMKVRDSRIYDEREFIWRVDNFSKMRDDHRWRSVILRRYSLKLCLSLWCYGDYLGFDCRILKGECDDYIKWPMKHKITLSMINQDTIKVHKSREIHFESFEGNKSAFDKPKNERWNVYFGDGKFTTVKDLRDSPGLLLNDSLIVSFNIDY